jgi:hypothetical protein
MSFSHLFLSPKLVRVRLEVRLPVALSEILHLPYGSARPRLCYCDEY